MTVTNFSSKLKFTQILDLILSRAFSCTKHSKILFLKKKKGNEREGEGGTRTSIG